MSDQVVDNSPGLSVSFVPSSPYAPSLSADRVTELFQDSLANLPEIKALARFAEAHPGELSMPVMTAFARVFEPDSLTGRDVSLAALVSDPAPLAHMVLFGFKRDSGINQYTFALTRQESTMYAMLSSLCYDEPVPQALVQLVNLKAFAAHMRCDLVVGYTPQEMPANRSEFITDVFPDQQWNWVASDGVQELRFDREDLSAYRMQPITGLTPEQLIEKNI